MSEAEPVSNESISIDMPNTAPVETPVEASTAPQITDIIPEEYADKGWVKDVKDINGLFKMTNDLKSQLGQRPAGIPHENSSEEEKTAFNKAFGVPEESGAYELSDPMEGQEEFQAEVKAMFLKAGLSQQQAASLDAEWNAMMQKMQPDPEAQEAEFSKMAEEAFGKDADKVLETANSLLTEHAADLPDNIKAAINDLPNNVLVPLAAVLDKIQQKYISEDDLPKPSGSPVTAMTPEQMREEGRRLMALPEYSNKSHAGHAEVMEKIRAIYGT